MLVIVKLCNGYVGVPYTLVSILVHYEKVFSKGYSEVQKVKKKKASPSFLTSPGLTVTLSPSA